MVKHKVAGKSLVSVRQTLTAARPGPQQVKRNRTSSLDLFKAKAVCHGKSLSTADGWMAQAAEVQPSKRRSGAEYRCEIRLLTAETVGQV